MTNSDSGTLVSEHIISYSALPVIGILLLFTVYFFSEWSGRTSCPVYNTSSARRRPSRPWILLVMRTTWNNYTLHATQNMVRNVPPPKGSRVYEGALMGHIVSHINLIQNLHTLRTHSNFIFQSTLTAPCHAFPSGVRSKLQYVFLVSCVVQDAPYCKRRHTCRDGLVSKPRFTKICKLVPIMSTPAAEWDTTRTQFPTIARMNTPLNQRLFPLYIIDLFV
jgi:hypothetical protein